MAYNAVSKNGVKLLIVRLKETEKQTQGLALILDKNNDVIYNMVCLELPFLENEKKISCIPPGEYQCRKNNHYRFGLSAHVLSVPGRTGIMIHKGNFHFNTTGCILLGYDFRDLNQDNLLDVTMSGTTMVEFYKRISENFTLIIK